MRAREQPQKSRATPQQPNIPQNRQIEGRSLKRSLGDSHVTHPHCNYRLRKNPLMSYPHKALEKDKCLLKKNLSFEIDIVRCAGYGYYCEQATEVNVVAGAGHTRSQYSHTNLRMGADCSFFAVFATIWCGFTQLRCFGSLRLSYTLL